MRINIKYKSRDKNTGQRHSDLHFEQFIERRVNRRRAKQDIKKQMEQMD
jgi:hypothetical protein